MKITQQPKLWTREFILILLVSLFVMTSLSIVASTLSLYIIDTHNGTSSEVGVISSMMILSALLIRPFTGFIVDRWGRKWILITSVFFAALLNLAMLIPMSMNSLGILRLIYGVPFALFSTAMNTMVSDIIPEERRSEGFSYFSISIMLTMMLIGPNLGFLLSERGNYPMIFILSGLFGVVGSLLVLVMKYRDIKNPGNPFGFNNLFEGRVLWLGLILGLIFLGWPAVTTFGPQYAQEVGYATASLFFLMYSLGMVFSRFLINRIYNPKSPRLAGLLALTLILVGFALTGLIRGRAGLISGGVCIGIGYGMAFATFTPLALNLVEVQRRGTCNSTLIFCQDIGAFLGTYVFGFAVQMLGSYATTYGSTALIILISIIVFLLITLPDYLKKYRHLVASNQTNK